MFLFWIKPKRKKVREGMDYHYAHDLYTPFFIAQALLTIMWIACIPFLFFAFSETIHPFLTVTVLMIVANLLSKLTDPNYYYF